MKLRVASLGIVLLGQCIYVPLMWTQHYDAALIGLFVSVFGLGLNTFARWHKS